MTPVAYDSFSMRVDVQIRPATAADLEPLEWFGLFTHDRRIILDTFEGQRCGEGLILVADFNGFPIGQVWLDYVRNAPRAYIWAVRVMPIFVGKSVGTSLMKAAEDTLRSKGFSEVLLHAEKENEGAIRFYRRLGYEQELSEPLVQMRKRLEDHQ